MQAYSQKNKDFERCCLQFLQLFINGLFYFEEKYEAISKDETID